MTTERMPFLRRPEATRRGDGPRYRPQLDGHEASEATGKKCSDSAALNRHRRDDPQVPRRDQKNASSARARLNKDIDRISFDLPSDDYNVRFPRALHERLDRMMGYVQRVIRDAAVNHLEAEAKVFRTRTAPEGLLEATIEVIE